ncbi:MAG: hypothetical protein D6715_00975 [Calditrichaeota bacterium]|nr:MAG: hypothetical protein D6715_00975 [Calditrichota bacterium]
MRRKWTLSTSADSIYGNLWAGSVLLAMEHHIGFDQQLGLELTPEFYQEDQVLGQTYQQIASRAYYRYYGGFNRNFEAEVDVAYRRFESRLNGDRYRNRYFAVRPALQAELPLTGNGGVAAEVEYEQRWHEEPSEVSPDFGHGKIRTLVKYYIEDFKSFGLGMVGEKQTFSAHAEASRHFVQQGNFVARGVVAEAEVMNLTGRMLNLTYEVEWRDFPNAETSIFDTFYSNRLVHSISGFAWIPIQQRWQLQFFVNYTNDLDREKSNNDSNNTVFSIGLIYKF